MNEIKIEERSSIEAICELIVNELFEIKMHICNERYFEGGVGLGGLMNSVMNRQLQEADHRRKNEKVQDEECDEEYEEGSEEEDSNQASFYTEYLHEKHLRESAEKNINDFMSKLKKYQDSDDSIKDTKRAIFDLQDLIMRLIKFKKIEETEIENVINILMNTGVEKCDLNVLCNLKEPEKTFRS